MERVEELLTAYGYQIVFGWAFVVQGGTPVPALPMLLGAGALAARGKLSLFAAVMTAVAATLLADAIWYGLGRLKGQRVFGIITRMALDPDSVVRTAKDRFLKHRLGNLVVVKFLPGVSALAAALAGTVHLNPGAFLGADLAGALLWAGGWMTVGYLAADSLIIVATAAARIGRLLIVLAALALALWIGAKWMRRRRFLRHLRAARITADELKRRLDAGERLVVVDARAALDVETVPYRIPGALRIDPDELLRGLDHPPPFGPEEMVVFYCSEPHEATSARIAMLAAKKDYRRVHPLSGGFDSWHSKGLPVEPVESSW